MDNNTGKKQIQKKPEKMPNNKFTPLKRGKIHIFAGFMEIIKKRVIEEAIFKNPYPYKPYQGCNDKKPTKYFHFSKQKI